MKQKERELLCFLVEHKNRFVTSHELAAALFITDRTVRSYIQIMKKTIHENGGEIISKRGYGFQLSIIQPLTFDLFLTQCENTKIYAKENEGPTEEIADRKNYILNKLLFEDENFLLDSLADCLYVSRSTLTKDFSEIRQLLKPYGLTVESCANKGVWIEGGEQDKRHFIMNYFFGNTLVNSFQKYMGNSHYFKDVRFEEITIIVLDECREAKIKLSDYIIQNLVLHLALSIKRINKGFKISNPGVGQELIGGLEYSVAKKIIRRIELAACIEIPSEEISYLALHLMAKSNHQQRGHKQIQHLLEGELLTALKDIEEDTGYPVVEDYSLRNGLLDHLRPLLVRLKEGIHLENPLVKEIIRDHGDVFQLTKNYLKKIPSLTHYMVDDHEWAYLTLHLMAAIEKYKDHRKLQVLIICATGYGSAQLLRNRVIKEFGKHLNIADVHGYYEINDQSLANIDLIISSVDLSTVVFGVPVLHVSVFLNDQDMSQIRKYLDGYYSKNCHKLMPSTKTAISIEQKQQMFDRQINKKLFKIFKGKKTKAEVIDALLQRLSENESETYAEQMKEEIRQRQLMSSVVFSNTIAVPHPALPIGLQTKIAVGIVPDGLYWDQDFPEIKFIFLLSPSYLKNEAITAITKTIVHLIDLPESQKEILSEKNFEQFRESFIKLM
ncbi:BglG family transcription antiterminator [Sporolactobacillus laevolacticus]|uniref:BglG family transcription antiterminator n=1 Tax=Sporolactobacillus laevolacticus TaxID=33018 RepID=UPI0025B509B6|nr:BglG family transcription antiterminator [Sporolactobacillus laevolacticus]MDN3954758.1 BglG family transcription antiterminator [Sporolactobacillus laevolacticus]